MMICVCVAFLVDVGAGAERDLAAAGAVAVEDALPAADDAAGREVGPGMISHQLDRCVTSGSSISWMRPSQTSREVVRRNLGGHADGDAVGAVDEQVGELARQDERLAVLAVVVVDEIDGVAFEVGEHLGGDGRQAGLGVPHGRRAAGRRWSRSCPAGGSADGACSSPGPCGPASGRSTASPCGW